MPQFNATCVERLQQAGCILAAKTNMDEFGMGSLSRNHVYGAVRNPVHEGKSAGGSSGGSAASVAAQLVDLYLQSLMNSSLGSDTGGSIRLPAAFCGLFGFKPSNGAISRFGLVEYAASLDTIGILARDIDTISQVFGSFLF